MLGKVKILRFNCNESNINIEFSDLIAPQKYENIENLKKSKRKQKKEKRLINSMAMKIMIFLH